MTTGPDLPEQFDWPQRTKDWWEVWRAAPQAARFTATDWDYLLDTALIHADFWAGNTAQAGELRTRLGKLGATFDDRVRLKIGGEAKVAEADPIDEIAQRRAARGAGTAKVQRRAAGKK